MKCGETLGYNRALSCIWLFIILFSGLFSVFEIYHYVFYISTKINILFNSSLIYETMDFFIPGLSHGNNIVQYKIW